MGKELAELKKVEEEGVDSAAAAGTNPAPNAAGTVEAEPAGKAAGTVRGFEDDGWRPSYEGYDDAIKTLERYKREGASGFEDLSPDELKKLRRREKARRIIAGVSDAAAAWANLAGTAHYAPNMYDGTATMSEATQSRWDKELAERKKDTAQKLEYALKVAQLRGQQEAAKLSGRDYLMKLADQQRKDALYPFERREAEAKADYWRMNADLKSGELDNQPTKFADQHAKALADIDEKIARAWKAYNGGSGKSGGGGGARAEHPYLDDKGNVHFARSKAAADAMAEYYGTTKEQEVVTEHWEGSYKKGETRTTKTVRSYERPAESSGGSGSSSSGGSSSGGSSSGGKHNNVNGFFNGRK